MALSAELKVIADELKLDSKIIREYLGRIAWRRRMMKSLRGDFMEKYPEDPMTMFLTSGRQYFDKDVVIARKRELLAFKPHQTMSNGEAKLYFPRVAGRRYMIGADPASGRELDGGDTDYCAAVVLDMETTREEASYRAKVTPQDFAHDLDDLGRYYNNALIGVERTGDGGTVILELQGTCKYSAVVKFKEWQRRSKKMIEIEGFPTTPRTRPHALNVVNEWLTYNPELIFDEGFLDEALIFVRNEKGIPAAAAGGHDDRVSARWIAHGCRQHILGYWEPSGGKREGYVSADRLEGVA